MLPFRRPNAYNDSERLSFVTRRGDAAAVGAKRNVDDRAAFSVSTDGGGGDRLSTEGQHSGSVRLQCAVPVLDRGKPGYGTFRASMEYHYDNGLIDGWTCRG
ncbi:hypothetical protein AWB68_05025 [Caballeronia choica]|uniref:Uncharacterized protein n=1 Tax=Caballeronia choica TaxID=326476 RepID=A0A158K647_9BURK|nr:hypothetical protein AWB68_05025 [Caballeronia choica]